MKREVIGALLIAMATVWGADAQAQQHPYTWTGLYLGANAGYAWGEIDITMTPGGLWSTEPVPPVGSHRARENGFTGGIQFGYNQQIGNAVLGIEVDVNSLHLEGSRNTGLLAPGLISPYIVSDSFKSHWLATLRPRVGAVFDQTLFYVTGGLAIGAFDFAQSLSFPTIPSTASGSVSGTRVGWTIGGGLERMVARNWSMKLEYLYVDFGDLGFSTVLPPPVAGIYTQEHEARLTTHIARIGLNYKFR